jgi:hypothetical protein
MISKRRRSPLALAAPVLVAALALFPLCIALAPTTARADTPAPAAAVHLTLDRLSPVAPQPGDTLVLAGRLTNISDSTLTGLAYELKMSDTPVIYRSVFDQYADAENAPLPATGMIGISPGPGLSPAIEAKRPSLAPGQSERFRIAVPVASLGLTDTWQIRELGISVTETTSLGFPIVGHLRTFLPWAPHGGSNAGVRAPLAWVWPLVDRPHRSTATTWFDDDLAPELGPAGRLGGLLAAGTSGEAHGVPLTWALDPMLVSDVNAMTTGYRVTTDGKTTTGTGTTAAKTWLSGLRTAVTQSGSGVIALPYGDPDVVAVVRAGFVTALGLASASGRTDLAHLLGTADPLQVGWPPGGLADQRTVSALTASGDRTVLLTDTAEPPTDGAPSATPAAHTTTATSTGPVDTVLSDSVLSGVATNGAANPDGARVSLQRYIAETFMIQQQAPYQARDVVVAPQHRWAPSPGYSKALLDDTAKLPWLHPIPFAKVQASPPDTTVARSLTYTPQSRRNELPPSYLRKVGTVRKDISAFGSILPQGNPQILAYTTAADVAMSSAWRTEPLLASSQLAALQTRVSTAMSQVRITTKAGSFVTLTSHGGKVPITVDNKLGTPVNVTVKLGSNQPRLSLSNGGAVSVLIPPHQQTQVEVHADAKTSGVFPLSVRLYSPNGSKYGLPVSIYVRSTVYGTITLVITGAATAALLVAVVIRLTRRALAARRATAPAGA